MKFGKNVLWQMLYWFSRLWLGVTFLATGAGKALDLPGFIGVMKTYELGLPEWALWTGGTAVTLFELALGGWILSGWRLRQAAQFSVGMNLGYLGLLTSALWRGLELQNCGCYGVFLARPLRWYTPLEDVFLIALSVALFYYSADRQTPEAGKKNEISH
ncbi:MAG: DoxX family membrane protein [Blastocatellia bacterium]